MGKGRFAVALIAIVNGEWNVSFHKSLKAAEEHGTSGKLGEVESGWTVETREHFDMPAKEGGIPDASIPSLYEYLSKGSKLPKVSKTYSMADARATTWELLAKNLVAGEEPAPEEPEAEEGVDTPAEDQPVDEEAAPEEGTAEASEEAAEESAEEAEVQPEEEEEVETQTAVSRTPRRAPPKAPAKAQTRASARAPARAPAKAPAAGKTPLRARTAPARAPAKAPARAAAPARGKAADKAPARERTSAGMTKPWEAVLKGIAKKGEAGLGSAEIAKLCEANGVRPFYARFSRSVKAGGKGYLENFEHGKYRITKLGKEALGL